MFNADAIALEVEAISLFRLESVSYASGSGLFKINFNNFENIF